MKQFRSLWLVRHFRRERLGLLLTAVAAAVCWAVVWRVWGPSDVLNRPLAYDWDDLFANGGLKSYEDRGLSSLWGAANPWLGAPEGAVWSDFPGEDILFFALGLVSRLLGTIATLNLAFGGTSVLSAVTLYAVCRRLRVARPLAAAAGLLFSQSQQLHYSGIGHLTVTMYWHVPLWFLVWAWASSRNGLRFGSGKFRAALAIALLTAVFSSYYLNFFMQVMLLLVVAHAVSRRWKVVAATVTVMASGMALYLATNIDTFLYISRNGPNTRAVARHVNETILYGLRPLELFWPSQWHPIDAFSRAGETYLRTAPMVGEFPSTYLGIVPGLAFIAFVLAGIISGWWGARRGVAGRFFPFAVWLVFVSMAGGLMQLSQMITHFVAFRSNNRVSIVLLGMGLLYAAKALSPRIASWGLRRAWVPWLIIAPVAIAGAWEEAPAARKRKLDNGGMRDTGAMLDTGWDKWRDQAASDKKFVAELESVAPEGSGVFQLPFYPFPEAGAVGGFGDYQPFRLYIHSHRKLRFSYGSMKGRPEAAWAERVATLQLGPMLEELKAKGFSTLVLDARIYPANVVEDIIATLSAKGPTKVVRADFKDWVAIVFAPTP